MILQDKWDHVSRNRKNGCKLTRTVDFQPLPYIFWKYLDEHEPTARVQTDNQCADTVRPSAFQEIQQRLGKAEIITVPDPVPSSIYPPVFQFISVAQSCPTLCDPMDGSTPGLPVHHQLPEFTQTHVHWVGDAIQPSHPLSSPSPTFNLSQHQGLF